jgi:hypothetical protein
VAFAVSRADGKLYLSLSVASFAADGAGTSVQVGLAGPAGKMVLADTDAQVRRGAAGTVYSFAVPEGTLVKAPDDWRRLRLAMAVRWAGLPRRSPAEPGGPGGADRLRERFRCLDAVAPHEGLPPRPEDWMPLDVEDYASATADRKDRIAVSFDQPMDGKATVVIEDAAGRRVRNLLAGAATAKGPHRIDWDGLDEAGRLVAPGTYRWRSAHTPGVVPQYLMSFCNGGEKFLESFGSNHGVFSAAAANSEYVFFAASITEGGYALIACDFQGNWKHGYGAIMGTGIYDVAIAADAQYLYVLHDGPAWGQNVDRAKPDWQAKVQVTLTRFEIATGRPVDYGNGRRFAVVETYDWGPGSAGTCKKDLSLTGLALADGKLYLASRSAQSVLVVDPRTGEKVASTAIPSPGPLAAGAGKLYAVSAGAVTELSLAGGAGWAPAPRTVLPAGALRHAGLAVDDVGNLYVTDAATSTVKVFDAAGKSLRTVGTPGLPRRSPAEPGGAYLGAYDPQRLVEPAGLVVAGPGGPQAGGKLWITERRWTPKRVSGWDLASGKVVVEKFGCPSYGGPGASVDPLDPTRWIGMGAMWKLDLATGAAKCTSILRKDNSGPLIVNYRYVRRDGRTFLIGYGGVTSVMELTKEGAIKDLAFVGSTHRYCFACDWNPPKPFIEAFNKAYPNKVGKHGDKGPGVLWVDRSGDGQYQADEFNFSTEVDDFAGAYWGQAQYDLSFRMPATVKGQAVIATLAPEDFTPGGAPRYPGLNAACALGVKVDLRGTQVETAVDRFGRVICNSDPAMKCFTPDGRTLWTYPNRWSNVHGSHDAPLPEVGVMQGCLFFLGMAELDERADVFVMNGNHGRFFVLTSDGLYLDEMFKDVRMGGSRDATYIGGECFGGSFARCQADGQYYLQTGGDGYRIYRLGGLRELKRGTGEVAVSARQVMAAERRLARTAATAEKPRQAVVPRRDKPAKIDGRDDDWPAATTLEWNRSGQFPVKVRCSYDERNLYLFYTVADSSPWVNSGKDWQTLFKTGDSVDLQIGTDASADPARRGPAAGDLRLLIAPFEGKPLAVLYRPRAPGLIAGGETVTFTSPWRSEKVDVVRKLTGAVIAVNVGGDGYRLEASVPLADLGLTAPAGKALRADFGVIYGDAAGTVNVLRSYWSNQATMLVNDVPGEIMLRPDLWGTVRFEK